MCPLELSPQKSPPTLSQQGQHISAGFYIFIQTPLSILCPPTLQNEENESRCAVKAHFAASCFSLPLPAVSCLKWLFVMFFCFVCILFLGWFFCGLFYFTSSSFLFSKGCTAGPPQLFETFLVKRQQLCGTHTPSSISSSEFTSPWLSGICCCLSHCCHSLMPQQALNCYPSPPKVIPSLPPKTAAAACVHSGLCLA